MAIQFLNGLNIDGDIDLNSNQIKQVRIDNNNGAPTGSLGRIYYDTGTNKLRLYNGAWVDIDTGTDGDTTYDLTGVGSTNGTAGVRLTGSDATTDDVIFTGAGTVSVTRSGNTLTVTGTDSAAGTVTNVAGGTGISITGSSSITPTVNIDTVGTDNAILTLTAADPVGTDFIWFSDTSDSNTLRKTLVSGMPGFGKDGTVTEVDSGAGLITSPVAGITATGSIAIDYAGADNLILAAADGTSVTVVAADKILVSDADDSNAKYVNISQITAAIGGGTVTSIDVSGGTTGLTTSGGPVTGSGTITLAGTLDANNGGTGQSSYTVGDILYASSTTALAKLGIGSAGQVLKVASGLPSWATDQNSGGTVTSITLAADSGSGTAITGVGTQTFAGAGLMSTSVTGTTVTISTTATSNLGTVRSIATGNGITGGTITDSGTLTVEAGDGLSQSATGLLVDNTVVRTTGAQTIAGVKTFSSQVVVPLTPTNDNNIASKAYVLSQIGGVGGFRGGYNASTNSPALSGGSNVAMALGDFFVVDVAGSTAGLGQLEPGDFVFADAAIAAGSSPAASAYTVVIADQNIAGAGTTDGGTIKGVAGFQSATFAATSNGFITVKTGGISDGQLASTFNKIIGIDTDINTSGVDVVDQISLTDGVVGTLTTRTLPTTSQSNLGVVQMATGPEATSGAETNIAISPVTLKTVLDRDNYTATFPSSNTNTTTFAAATHGLGTGPFIIQVYSSSTGIQQYLDVTANPSTGAVTLATTSNQTANSLRFVMQKVRT